MYCFMELLSLAVGFFGGFLLGAGALLVYIRWKMMSQINAMQENMQGMFDMTDDMMGGSMDADFEIDEGMEEKED